MEVNMILKTESSKVNFLKGLIRVAKCDTKREESEVCFFNQAALAMGLGDEILQEINSAWFEDIPIKIFFETSEEKMFFFIQAIQLCNIDGSYDAVEKAEIRIIANELQISVDAILKVEEWVEEGLAWNKRGDTLLELK